MPSYSARVSSDGSVSLPKELRDRLGIVPGSEVEFFLTVDGQVHFHRTVDAFATLGVPIRRPPVSVREMDDAVTEEVIERDARSKSPAPGRDRSAAE